MTNPMKWPIKRFKDICTVGSSKRVYQSEQTSAGVPFLRVSDLISKIVFNTETCDLYISEQQFNEFEQQGLVPHAGDILVTARGTLGQCYIIKPKDKFYFQDGMISWVHTSEAEINPVYVSYLFDSQGIRQQIDKVVSGTTVAYLSIAQLSNFDILLPAIELQNQFADFVAFTDKSKLVTEISIAVLKASKILFSHQILDKRR
ncbi:putative type I restriction-modification system S subunit [Selenomonas ruminantium subsp. lactilytica TAM6421]|uniref:Putative type I restriction-modification system S subunit n=2 Tax=Selenomonas ruminantium TaxID=971 RepID=I0GSH0_SELRL|nr:putative type I restriction-modification system S subunit [Selenomonas ruminantium subsp. lactilytica TAM6421]